MRLLITNIFDDTKISTQFNSLIPQLIVCEKLSSGRGLESFFEFREVVGNLTFLRRGTYIFHFEVEITMEIITERAIQNA